MFFSKKKKDDPKPAEDAEPAGAAAGVDAGSDIFGGMSVASTKTRRGKRKGTVGPGDAPTPTASSANGDEPQHHDDTASQRSDSAAPTDLGASTGDAPKENKFFSKFDFKQSASHFTVDEEDPETAAIRSRLERFYEEYNPSKLSSISTTMAAYKGRETDLFAALVKKYGPEPPAPSANDPAKKEKEPSPPAADGFGSANGFADSGEPAADNGDGGFGNNDGWGNADATGSGGGWGDAENNNGDGGFGGATFGESSEGGAGGFGFATDAPAGDSSETGGGFGFVSNSDEGNAGDASSGGGFGFVNDSGNTGEDVEQASGFGFATGGNDANESNEEQSGFGFAATTAAPASESPAPASDSDSDDEPTMNERHRKELKDAKAAVSAAKATLSDAVDAIASTIRQRQDLVSQYRATEREIETCITKEDYEKADELDKTLTSVIEQLDEIDAREPTQIAELRALEEDISKAMQTLAETYTRQRQEIVESKAEEERRMDKYITETSSRLGQTGEKVRAELDRATRRMNNTDQEVVNLEHRRTKIMDKISEQTKPLEEKRTAVSTEKDELEVEIRELEAKLAAKRRNLAEVKTTLSDLDEKLTIIREDHAEAVSDIEGQLKEENNKLVQAQEDVKGLEEQEQDVINDERALEEEKQSIEEQLQSNNRRVEIYATLSRVIKNDTISEVEAHWNDVLTSILDARSKGTSFLCPRPRNDDEAADTNGPLAELAKVESRLASINNSRQAEIAKQSALSMRRQDIDKNLPLLEIAKKTAAQSKQFKEASAKTAEIKQLTEERTELEEQLAESATVAKDLDAEESGLKSAHKAAKKAAQEHMSSFINEYREVVKNTSDRSAIGTSLQAFVDRDEVDFDESNPDAPTIEDDVGAACFTLATLLRNELARIDTANSPVSSPNARQASSENYPTGEDAAADEGAATPANEEEPAAAALSEEEIAEKITALEADLAAAEEAEEYDKCAEIQDAIDALKA